MDFGEHRSVLVCTSISGKAIRYPGLRYASSGTYALMSVVPFETSTLVEIKIQTPRSESNIGV